MASRSAAQQNAQVRKLDDVDIGALVVSTSTNFVKNRPKTVGLWVLGLLLAAFANGFNVSETQRDVYKMALGNAEEVDKNELTKALYDLRKAEDRHYQLKGWFWACDDACQKAKDRVGMAQASVNRIRTKRDGYMREAREEVGIWSIYGVAEIRNSFWSAWQAGKDLALRWSMWDAVFMMFDSREETIVTMAIKLLLQYIMNLTIGLCGAFVYFTYNVYCLIVAYGEPALSGIAFFLLVLVAGLSLLGTYLLAIYGTVAGGALFVAKQAAKAALENQQRGGGRPPQRVQNQNHYRSD